MTDDEREAHILSGAALFESMGGFKVAGWNADRKEVTATFTVRREFCHTNATTAQGGFITAWLDAAMAHAVMFDSAREFNAACAFCVMRQSAFKGVSMEKVLPLRPVIRATVV